MQWGGTCLQAGSGGSCQGRTLGGTLDGSLLKPQRNENLPQPQPTDILLPTWPQSCGGTPKLEHSYVQLIRNRDRFLGLFAHGLHAYTSNTQWSRSPNRLLKFLVLYASLLVASRDHVPKIFGSPMGNTWWNGKKVQPNDSVISLDPRRNQW